jgi:predicted TIM-barrel fold metal-dependent hydrolase
MHNGYKVYDVHGHVSTTNGVRAYGLTLLSSNTASPRSPLQNANRQGDMADEALKRAAQAHVDYMDERDIDIQIIGPRPFTMLGWMEPHLLPAWTRITNDSIWKQVTFFPDRFIGAAMLPQNAHAPDSKHMLEEADRCKNELGFKAVYLTPDPTGRRDSPGMHEHYWDDIYDYCQRNNWPIIVHGTNCLDPRIGIIPQNYQVGFFYEQWLARQLLGHSDVFDRFPELKVCICHGGGAIDRFIKTDNHLAQRDLSKNMFYDTCVYDLDALTATIKQRGLNQMLFGAEAPGSGRAVRPETGKSGDNLIPELVKFDWLSDADRKKILHDNPAGFCAEFDKVAGASAVS